MRFSYTAKNQSGQNQTGTVEAASRELAINVLQRHGLIVTNLDAQEAVPYFARLFGIFHSVSLKDLAIFSRQFATLLEAKVPIIDALRTLEKQTDQRILREAVFEIISDVEAGLALSAAIGRHDKIFSSFFVSMIKSGEVSGNLEEVLSYLADYSERQYDLQTKIRGALWYPVLIFSFFIVIAVVMIQLINTNLRPFLLEFGAETPWPTKILLGLSQFLGSWLWLLGILLAIGIVFFWRYIRTPEGKFAWDSLRLHLPIFGRLYKYLYITHFAETLGTLIAGGIPISQALIITADVVGNEVYKNIIFKANEAVRSGEMTSRIIAAFPQEFPPVVSQMMAIGEKTGRLEDLLKRVAGFYRRELDKIVNNLVVLIEPVLIIALGAMVGLLIAAVLLPIYSLVTTLSISG